MLVPVRILSSGSRQFDFSLTAEQIGEALPDRPDLIEVRSIKADLSADMIRRTITVRGTVDVEVVALCSRCGAELHRTITLPVRYTLLPASLAGEYGDEDEGFGYYNEDQVDLTECVAQTIALDFPGLIYCEPSCGSNVEKT
ncbi:MAG: DUF177 domain-containing protein [Deltaproteobacteria bacterium]|nr:DUF177 domain-containing protein [Deltaproteobacteria bacterium]